MNVKRIFILMSLIFFLMSSVFLLVATTAATSHSTPAENKRIIVYYFHGDFRCRTCLQIEALTKKAVTGGSKTGLPEAAIKLEVINIDRTEHAHFINDFYLETRSVIISEYNGSKLIRWKNLSKIWDYYSDEKAFINYIQSGIKEYL